MPAAPSQIPLSAHPRTALAQWKVFLAAFAIALAALLAYRNSFHVPFLLDDAASITNNPTLQQGFVAALQPPANGETVTGRPLVNLSLAFNYSLGEFSVDGYHAVNLAIHLLAGWVLFGLVRRTLQLPSLQQRWGDRALMVALGAALLWTLHPLQTESVTYIVQRAESLAGLFYLLTLYCFVRALGSPHPRNWLTLSALACLLGVFCKETVVTAPLLVLLYDRAFAGGTLATALQQRGKYYAALAATWIPLAWLVWSAGNRGGSAGFNAGVDPLAYALTQARAITDYLRLSFWPQPLVFDYGAGLAKNAGEVAPQLALVAALVLAAIYLLWKKPALGFLTAWFLVTLAPSSSIVPIATETIAEHRMYLPLAALAVLVALGLNLWRDARLSLAITGVLALALGAVTFARNNTYRDSLQLWRETAQNCPDSARAHENYAAQLINTGWVRESLAESRRALELQPVYPNAEMELGIALAMLGQPAEAIPPFTNAAKAFRLPRERALAFFNLGNALAQSNQLDSALAAYTVSTQLQPDYAPAHNLRGYVLAKQGRYAEAITEYEAALKLQPEFPQCIANLVAAREQLAQHTP